GGFPGHLSCTLFSESSSDGQPGQPLPVTTGGPPPQPPPNSDFLTQVRQILMDRLKKASGSVDINDPSVTVPIGAALDQATREQEAERTALAERLYAQGGSGGGSPLQSNALAQG